MSNRLKEIHQLLHQAVDWCCWFDESPGPEREREAIGKLRRIFVRLLLISVWRRVL
jgi:hypothetical protein